MSAIPSRTRSLQKPSQSGAKIDRTNVTELGDNNSSSRAGRTSQSPSRLPVKPPTSRIMRSTPSTSTATASRPPSASSTISNGSMRPPPPRANTSKPAASGLQRSSSIKKTAPASSTEPDPAKKDRSRPPITVSRHVRNVSASSLSTSAKPTSGHTRTRSSTTLLTSSSTALPPPTRSSTFVAPKPQPADPPLIRKPAFNTLQQHFSPAKNLAPKPHPATFLAPPSPSKLPSNIAISAETSKLQNELLQLHILHRSAGQTDASWRASAKRKLGARFQSVVERNAELLDLEVKECGKRNAAAVRKWQDQGAPGWALEDKIQILDEVLTGVWNLGDSATGGKYARVVRRFERWLSRCQSVLSTRESKDGLENEEVMFIDLLDQTWKDDCLLIGRKLDSWLHQLRDLGMPDKDPGSSLAILVGGCWSLVEGILMELAVMAQIESDAMAMEREWIRKMNEDGLDNSHDKNNPVAGAVWRST